MNPLYELLKTEIAEIYILEKQLLNHFKTIINGIKNPVLRELIQSDYEQTKEQFNRLEHICEILNFKPNDAKSHNHQDVLDKMLNISETDTPSHLKDADILSNYKKILQTELACYNVVRGYSQTLEELSITKLLDIIIEEQTSFNDKLSEIGEKYIYPRAKF